MIVLYVYWTHVRPLQYQKLYKQMNQNKGFKYSYLTNGPEEKDVTPPITNTNSHTIWYKW